MRRVPTNLVHAQVLAPYERLLREESVPVESLFEHCGIPPEAVFGHAAMITMRQAHRLSETAARHTGDETLGAKVARRLQLDELGAISETIQQSATLFDARSAIQGAAQDAEPGSRMWIELDRARAWFCYRPARRFSGGIQSEIFDLQCLLKCIRLAAGDDWLPREIQVTSDAERILRRLPEFSNASIRRHERNTAIALPRACLSQPIAKAADGLDQEMKREIGGWWDGELSVTAAVGLVLESLSEFEPLPSLVKMADRFGVRDRTLQRALADDKTSYRHLAERLMFRRAVALLADESLSVANISDQLGYGSPNSFIRAFRRVAGATPMAYRRRREQDAESAL